jgi:hypothetical protein
MFVCKFCDVGRNKANWTACTDSATYDWLLNEVKKHAGVMSRCLDFYFEDEDFKHGVIEAGFRVIGRYDVEEVSDNAEIH